MFTSGGRYRAGNASLIVGTPTPVMFASRHDGDGREYDWSTPILFPDASASDATTTMRTGEQMRVAGSATPNTTGVVSPPRQNAFAQLPAMAAAGL